MKGTEKGHWNRRSKHRNTETSISDTSYRQLQQSNQHHQHRPSC